MNIKHAEILTSITRFWQVLLRLSDWDVEVKTVRTYEEPGNYAVIRADRTGKTATLSFVDIEDWSPAELTGSAVEDTVVHELLHLHFRQAGYEYDEEKEELVVSSLAKAFRALREMKVE